VRGVGSAFTELVDDRAQSRSTSVPARRENFWLQNGITFHSIKKDTGSWEVSAD